jgi:hypothetical protein
MTDHAQIKKWQDEILRLKGLIQEQHQERRSMRIWLYAAAVAGPAGFFYRPWLGPVLVGFLVTIFGVGVYLTHVHISERTFLLERAREELARLGGQEVEPAEEKASPGAPAHAPQGPAS